MDKKRYGHVQTEIIGDRKYLESLIKKYKIRYEVRKIKNCIDDGLKYEIKLSDDCFMILTEAFYVDDNNQKHGLITQVIYKL